MMTFLRRVVTALALVALGSVLASADTLVLRNGRSFKGELISAREGRMEFRTNRGRVETFRLEEVDRIEFRGRDGMGAQDDRARNDRGSDDRDSRAPGNERPAGMRERELDVPGNAAWTPTSIELRDGDELWFDARGEVRWGPSRKDGPGGETGSPRNAARPIPSRPAVALIGKIGEQGDPFFIGTDRGPIRVRARGTLFLGVNDDYLADNNGAFHVTVYY